MKIFLAIVTLASSIFSFTMELEKKESFTSADGYQFITFVDWDRDGLIDMLEVDTKTEEKARYDVLLFKKNIGTLANPKYSDGEKILDENGDLLSFPHG